uniref:Prolixicin antimicrobial protein n=1 Tax=Coptotermes formosanus TaxID=36987 RepID=L0AVF3_COPFO|nr:prolixicin antimicrobial protein [Coptotermes formosanus]
MGRVRRSPLPDPQAGNLQAPNPRGPNPRGPNPQGRGNVGVDVQRERGVGTVVRGTAEGNIYRSRDGNTRLDAEGHYSRVLNGPARGQRDYGAGIRFSHRW